MGILLARMQRLTRMLALTISLLKKVIEGNVVYTAHTTRTGATTTHTEDTTTPMRDIIKVVMHISHSLTILISTTINMLTGLTTLR